MKNNGILLLSAFLLSLGQAEGQTPETAGPATEPELNHHVMVVYNKNEPSGEWLARYYASARKIDEEHILAISCPTDETVTREVFEDKIQRPIEKYFLHKGWLKRIDCSISWANTQMPIQRANGNPIWALTLIRGIPLRIAEDPTIPPRQDVLEPLRLNRASVDSELALLPCKGLPLCGYIPNPYYSEKLIRLFSQAYADWMILVARLDGPSPIDVKNMIDSAIEAEKFELTGRAYFDSRNITDPANGYFTGDDWIRKAADLAGKAGFETSLDTSPEVVPERTPWDSVALYAGWYAPDCTGPFLQPDFRFQPGAIAYHLHSFSAETIRSTSKGWVGPLISRGVAATMGSVYEPYLKLTPDISIFFRNLLAGLSFGEAAYQSQPCLSWTITIVGDPLYRPFPRQLFQTIKLAADQKSPKLPWLILRLSRLVASQQDRPLEDRLNQLRSLSMLCGDSAVFQEAYGDILQELKQPPESVISAYRQAVLFPNTGNATIRCGLKLADYYLQLKRTDDAMAVYEQLLNQHMDKAVYFQIPQIVAYHTNKEDPSKLGPSIPKPALPAVPAP